MLKVAGIGSAVSAPAQNAAPSTSTPAPVAAPATMIQDRPADWVLDLTNDLLTDRNLDPCHREVTARLGCATSYAIPPASGAAGRLQQAFRP